MASLFKFCSLARIPMTPFFLRIFVADGDPDGLRIVDQSNWSGKAVVLHRALLSQIRV